jgi:hypothetical protein
VVKRLQPAVIEPEISRLFEQEAQILYNLGKKTQSKQCFDKFTEDYKSFMGIAFKGTFEQFRGV